MSTKYRYYIVSVMNGEVKGSNDEEVAKQMCDSQDDFVIDTEKGVWVTEDMVEVEIEEQKLSEEETQDGSDGVAEREG